MIDLSKLKKEDTPEPCDKKNCNLIDITDDLYDGENLLFKCEYCKLEFYLLSEYGIKRTYNIERDTL